METSIKKKIEFYCAYQERCKMEVTQKLRKLGILGGDLDKYIYHLINNDFLNEKRFSKHYVRGKFNNNDWGRIKIIRELESRKISVVNINNGLSEINQEDYLKKKNIKIGILGGTFDPAHKGHLTISRVAKKKIKLNYIIWSITQKNPFKKQSKINIEKRIKISKKSSSWKYW